MSQPSHHRAGFRGARLPVRLVASGARATHCLLVGALLALLAGPMLPAAEPATPAATYDRTIKPFIATYCSACHDAKKHKGDIDFASVGDGGDALAHLPLWRAAWAQLAAKDMPPTDEKQPADDERRAFAAWLVALRAQQPRDPGVAIIRRLSRVEYANTLRDLFGAPVDAGADLPADQAGSGFDNSLSPLLAEKYLLAADAVLDRFIVPEQMNLSFPAARLAAVVAGQPEAALADGTERVFTTPGEIFVPGTVPVAGTYAIKVRAGAEAAGAEPVRVAVRLDGKVVQELVIAAKAGAKATYTCSAKLLPGRVAISLLYANPLAQVIETPVAAKPAAPGTKPGPTSAKPGPTSAPKPPSPAAPQKPAKDAAVAAKPRSLTIDSIDIVGPPGRPPSEVQRRLFVAVPGKDLAPRTAAGKILTAFAQRAYRRVPRPAELALLLAVFDLGTGQELVFSEAVKLALKAVLVSPQFLYRTPEQDAEPAQDGVVAVGDWELASRLSYFLWATMPDDELLRLAQAGQLHEPAVLAAQVKRLLADQRARNLAETFAAPWLGLDRLADLTVDLKRYPMMTAELRKAMYEEGIAFFLGLLQGGGSLLDALDCDYAWMNGLTARVVYGNTEVKGPAMQKVRLADDNRGGVLTMPGVLAVTSMPSRTSPVKRGKWILEQLLDAAPPPPPPDVPDLGKQDTAANAKLTLRQRTERHRSDPACAACHRVMDPLGFGLENFDAIGRWRTVDDYGAPVDALGELPGRQQFSSPAGLRKILVARKEEFVRAFAGRLLAFALGRRLSGYDEVVVDELTAAVLAHGCRLDDLVQRIVASHPFLHRHALDHPAD